MNDDCRRIFEMLTAINARLEMNERLTQQIDNQLALLNIKREAELAELRTNLGISTRENDLLTIRMTLQNLSVEIGKLGAKFDSAETAKADSVKFDELKSTLQNLTAAVEKIGAETAKADSVKFDELKSTLQNLTAAVEKIGAETPKADSVKFDELKSTLQNLTAAVEKVGAETAKADSVKFDELKSTLQNLTAAVEKIGAETAKADSGKFDELKSTLQNLTAAVEKIGAETPKADEILTIQMSLQNLSVEIGRLSEKLDAKNDAAEISKTLDELKNAAKKSVRADDLLTIKMALQNSSIAINDVKKRVDGLKFDTTKKFNELSVNSEINHKALMAAIEKLNEPEKTQAEIDAENFKVCGWWNGDKER